MTSTNDRDLRLNSSSICDLYISNESDRYLFPCSSSIHKFTISFQTTPRQTKCIYPTGESLIIFKPIKFSRIDLSYGVLHLFYFKNLIQYGGAKLKFLESKFGY